MVTTMFDDEEQQRRYEQFQQRRDKYLGRNAPQEMPEIIYKRYEHALQRPEPQTALMDEAASAPWNRWLDNRISKYMDLVSRDMDVLADTIADELGTTTGKMEREFRSGIAKLRAEIEILRKGGGNE
jgi:hypothetical protein